MPGSSLSNSNGTAAGDVLVVRRRQGDSHKPANGHLAPQEAATPRRRDPGRSQNLGHVVGQNCGELEDAGIFKKIPATRGYLTKNPVLGSTPLLEHVFHQTALTPTLSQWVPALS